MEKQEEVISGDYTQYEENVMDQSLVPVIEPPVALDVFRGISEIDITEKEREILEAPADEDDIDIRPDGLIYLSHMRIRERFSKAFGPGKWSLMPVSPIRIKDNLAVRDWVMFIKGKFFSYAIGEAAYNPKNKMMTWGDVLETMKSNALSRLAKDIPIAPELWSRRYVYQFQQKHCVKVNYIDWKGATTGWRRVDSPPFEKETGVCEDSPNKDKYVRPAKSPSVPKELPKNPAATPVKKVEDEKQVVYTHESSPSDPKPQFTDSSLIVVWDGKTQKPAQEMLSIKAVESFRKLFENTELFKVPQHLTRHLKDHFGAAKVADLTYEKATALAKHLRGEGDDPRWYKAKEKTGKSPERPDVGVDRQELLNAWTDSCEEPRKEYNSLPEAEKERIEGVLEIVRAGGIEKGDIAGMVDVLMAG